MWQNRGMCEDMFWWRLDMNLILCYHIDYTQTTRRTWINIWLYIWHFRVCLHTEISPSSPEQCSDPQQICCKMDTPWCWACFCILNKTYFWGLTSGDHLHRLDDHPHTARSSSVASSPRSRLDTPALSSRMMHPCPSLMKTHSLHSSRSEAFSSRVHSFCSKNKLCRHVPSELKSRIL